MTSDKSDFDLGDLKRAMDAATPAPDAARRAVTLSRAQAVFERSQGQVQGSRDAARQTPVTAPKRGPIAGMIAMLMTRTAATGLTATTALVAGLVFLTPMGPDWMQPPGGEPVISPEAPDAAPERAVPAPVAESPGGADAEIGEREFSAIPRAAAPSANATRVAPSAGADMGLARGNADDATTTQPANDLAVAQEGTAPDAGETASATAEADGTAPDAPAGRTGGGGITLSDDAERGLFGGGPGEPTNGNRAVDFGAIADMRAPAEPGAALPVDPVTGLVEVDPFVQGSAGANADANLIPPAPDTEDFANADANPVRVVAEDPVSTFSSDVDTAAYALIRSVLMRGQLPPRDAVRIEEMVNYFPYDYAAPEAGDISPFRPTINVFQTPWNPDTQLIHIGIQGEVPPVEDRPPLNLVFLIDTSGSMNDPAKLPLLIQSFRLMLDRLNPADEVAIVTYAGSAGVALEPTPASDSAAISAALTGLRAGGSTNGAGGLRAAYDLAAGMTQDGEVSRVLLATDGDFNVGLSDPDALTDYIADRRDSGIYLSVLGFGRGNLQDDTMQALAQNGNGTAAYIDTLHEAQRVLVDQLAGALYPIADDLKLQVEFNPAVIAEYRLIGYETRALTRAQFSDDAVDAGELGAGHSVTAIYEVTPVGSPARLTDALRYGGAVLAPEVAAEFADELGYLSVRWKDPGAAESTQIDIPITEGAVPDSEAQFAAAIAGFGQLLRGDEYLNGWGYGDAIGLANANRGADPFGTRAEAVQLMRLAQSLAGE